MPAQYFISGDIAQRSYHFVSLIGEDAVEFYSNHAGRQGESRSDAVRFNKRKNNVSR